MNPVDSLAPVALILATAHLVTAAILVPPLLLWLRWDQRSSATRRHWYCRLVTIVLLGLLVVPLVPRPQLIPGTDAITAALETTPRAGPVAAADSDGAGVAGPALARRAAHATPAAPPNNHAPWLLRSAFLAWLTISLALLARLGQAVRRSRRLRREARLIDRRLPELASDALPEIRAHPDAESPLVIGIFRPMIVLPAQFVDRATAPELAAVLRHEQAHVRRGDALEEFLARLLSALCWFDPLLPALGRARAAEREAACDDAASVRGIERGAYARLLIDLATPRRPDLAAITMASAARRELEMRISALYSSRPRDLPGWRPSRAAFVVTLLGVGLIAAVHPRIDLLSSAAAEAVTIEPSRQDNSPWSGDLARAVMAGNAPRVDALLARRPAGSGPDDLRPALVAAARLPDPASFHTLVNAGADWRGIDGRGAFLLSVAATSSAAVLAELLALGADPDGSPGRFMPPLIGAARNPDQRALELLIDAGAELETQWRNTIPLTATMAFGPNRAMLANMEFLIAAGADVNRVIEPDREAPPELTGATPLHHAVAMGRVRFAERLLVAGADPNQLVIRHLPDGATLSIAPLTEADRQAEATGSDAMATLLRRYGAVPLGDPAKVIEEGLARHALRTEDQSRTLTAEETRQVLTLIASSIPGLPSKPTFERVPTITRQDDGRWTFSEPLAAWPESEHRRRSRTVACELAAETAADWTCHSAKARYRQRLDEGERWFTVSGEVGEARVRELVELAQTAAPGCAAAEPRFVGDLGMTYVVLLSGFGTGSAEVTIVEDDGTLAIAPPVRGNIGCLGASAAAAVGGG